MASNFELNETNKTIDPPDQLKLDLRRHQKAMLYRCLDIEKKVFTEKKQFGIISDKAGAGKTAVIISLILADIAIHGKTQNLIIVPQNIFTQWEGEFKKFAGDSLSVGSFTNYSDISNLFMNNDILKEHDVLITTVLYYDMISGILNHIGANIRRVIFDEIDTMSDIIDNIFFKEKNALTDKKNSIFRDVKDAVGSKSKITWFISASFYRAVTNNGFKFKDKTISLKEIQDITCKCDDSFVDKYNFAIPTPEYKDIECDDISDKFFNFLSVKQLDSINSISYQNIFSDLTNKIATDSKSCLKIIFEDYTIRRKNKKVILEDINSKKNPSQDLLYQKIDTEKDIKFYTALINSFHKVLCKEETCDIEKCANEKIDSFKQTNTKLNNATSFLREIQPDNRVLIFSDFSGGFKPIYNLLDKVGLKYSELNGGTQQSISKSIDEYKSGKTNVMLIDSSSEGCGINLENTTHILFIHKTSEILRNQIIGRAQRPGRTNKLKIFYLINNNEKV